MDSISQIVLDKLQAVRDRAMNAHSEKVFFLALYDFVVVFDQEESLTPVISQIMDMGQKEKANLNKLELQALEEMSTIYQEISSYVNEHKITDKNMLDDLDSYRGYDEKRIESSDGPTSGKHGELAPALSMLLERDKEKKHIDFVRKFGQVRDDGYIEEWTFAPSFMAWEIEKKKIDRLKITRLWHSLDMVLYFYRIYTHYESIRHTNYENKQFMTVMGLAMIYQEIEYIFEDKISQYDHVRHWNMEMYKTHLDRIFTFAKEYLAKSSIVVDVPKISMTKSYMYDKASGILSFGKKSVGFRLSGYPAELLKLLTANKRSSSQSWDVIYEKITGVVPGMGKHRKDKQKIYDIADNIASRIAKVTGVTDFLQYDFERVRINPAYVPLEK